MQLVRHWVSPDWALRVLNKSGLEEREGMELAQVQSALAEQGDGQENSAAQPSGVRLVVVLSKMGATTLAVFMGGPGRGDLWVG